MRDLDFSTFGLSNRSLGQKNEFEEEKVIYNFALPVDDIDETDNKIGVIIEIGGVP